MKKNGFTLVELLIVIAIAGILVLATLFSFTGWQGKYKVESQIKGLYDDLLDARVRAMQRKRVHFVSLVDSTSYTMYDDDSDGTSKVPDGDGQLQTGSGNNADTEIPSYPKTVEYDISLNGAVPSDDRIDFNTRGIVQPAATPLGGTICIFTDFDGDGVSDSDPDYDCIVISATRINMGKIPDQVGACNSANCDAK